MSKPPAFQFYADDFLAGVADMTQAEVGAYILLLCHQWNRGSAPVEPERQQLLAKGPVTDHVISKFDKQSDGSLKNGRMEKEREKQSQYRDKQRVKGLNSGESRRAAAEQRLNSGSATVQPQHEPNVNREATLQSPSPVSVSKETHTNGDLLTLEVISPPADIVTAEMIYQAYPIKAGKPPALRAIFKAMKKVDPKKLLDLTQAYAKRRAGDLEFVPHPSTWFNQERFNDDPSTWAKGDQFQIQKPAVDPDVWNLCDRRFSFLRPPRREDFERESDFATYMPLYESWRTSRLRQKGQA